MLYSFIADIYEKIEETTKRLEIIDHLVNLFKETNTNLIDKVVYLTQGKLYPDYIGVEIGIAEKLAMRAIAISTGNNLEKIRTFYKKVGDIGLVAEKVLKSRKQSTLFKEQLTVNRVYTTLDKIAKTSGPGSLNIKLKYISSLFNDATPKEAKYIIRTVTGKLRLGVADYTVLDALAIAYTGDKSNRPTLERAYNLSSDLGTIAKTVASQGLKGIKSYRITINRPVRPMLSERLETVHEIIEKLNGKCIAEYKLDGERIQIHKNGSLIKLFSRRLENITNHYPDVIDLAMIYLKADKVITEAECVAVNPDTGKLLPFQELMHRRRKYEINKALIDYPVSLFFFDILYLDGEDLTQRPYLERREKLKQLVTQDDRIKIVPSIYSDDPKEIENFLGEAIANGCEGIMAKDPNGIYRAGAREFSWIKLKREYGSELGDTLDLVIVGAFYGRGRRAGKYGAFLLTAYDKDNDMFRSVSKIGTGFTDETLEKIPKILAPYKIDHIHARVDSKLEADVWFIPHIVIEVIAAEITISPIHTCCMNAIRKGSGLALRFPKYTGRLRNNKAPEDATTVKEIEEIYKGQLKRVEKQKNHDN
ncbi:MAG: ATP-dependent DNA ligase [Candidatus Methylarchaceae archaeon HK02M2]|nr:ATP-dependent DNA ligase [Candidatus Methylarchaceae archaeon HK02M2]